MCAGCCVDTSVCASYVQVAGVGRNSSAHSLRVCAGCCVDAIRRVCVSLYVCGAGCCVDTIKRETMKRVCVCGAGCCVDAIKRERVTVCVWCRVLC